MSKPANDNSRPRLVHIVQRQRGADTVSALCTLRGKVLWACVGNAERGLLAAEGYATERGWRLEVAASSLAA